MLVILDIGASQISHLSISDIQGSGALFLMFDNCEMLLVLVQEWNGTASLGKLTELRT